ncbi:hypothetical protein GGQ64_004988 [Rhizobium azooxidifex]|uniref:Uncharacterized protein n=1 Tax=Mycoplana azooxidifex TaxID=1636188 RepID=A0A7W6GM00_9HYPH|nr:hypothetical protein [Mycoplana azooxidifex]MBB3979743.1 hypothetical protein [Mycoplana azooxidifex]
MSDKKQVDKALEDEGDDGPSGTFLGAIEEDGEIVRRDRIQVRRGIDRRPLKRTKMNRNPDS